MVLKAGSGVSTRRWSSRPYHAAFRASTSASTTPAGSAYRARMAAASAEGFIPSTKATVRLSPGARVSRQASAPQLFSL